MLEGVNPLPTTHTSFSQGCSILAHFAVFFSSKHPAELPLLLLLWVMSFSERSYQELQFLVFHYVLSSEKTSVICFGLDSARDKINGVHSFPTPVGEDLTHMQLA